MTIITNNTTVSLEEACTISDAEPLLNWLIAHPRGKVQMKDCANLHTSVLQVLLACRATCIGPPVDRRLYGWLDAAVQATAIDSDDDKQRRIEHSRHGLKQMDLITQQIAVLIEGGFANFQSNAVRESEQFYQSSMGGLAATISILDNHGTILGVNQAWREFADQNSQVPRGIAVGVNYLKVCDAAVGIDSEEAEEAADGIRAVIAGKRDKFGMEYPCHSPTENRWFRMRVSPLQNDSQARVVVSHENISEHKWLFAESCV